MNTVIIIQARMGSSRLPGKVLKTVLGKTLMEYQIERLQRVPHAKGLVIATTDRSEDEPIVSLCKRLGVAVFCGPAEDVLARYYLAATEFNAKSVVRITADCPLIDPAIVEKVIDFYRTHRSDYDYVSNTFPELTYPRGMDTEVFSYWALAEAYRKALDPPEREHVTIYIKRRPETFRICNLPYEKDYSHYRWTVDTPEDFALISKMLEALIPVNPHFSLADCLALIQDHPDWAELNSDVKQRLVK